MTNVDNLAQQVKHLIDTAKQTQHLSQPTFVQLHQLLQQLIDATDNHQVCLLLITQMSLPQVPLLSECGIRSIGYLVNSTSDPAMLDHCYSHLISASQLALQLQNLQLSLACAETLVEVLADNQLWLSPDIWKSQTEDTAALATYLPKCFDLAHQLHMLSQNRALRESSKAQCLTLGKSAVKLTQLTTGTLAADQHLEHPDVGMKRSILAKYCQHIIKIYRDLFASPPQFKAVWESLCSVVVNLPPGSSGPFDVVQWCIRVCRESCQVTRSLAQQTMEGPANRINMQLSFTRFIVFNMPRIMDRIRRQRKLGEVMPDALEMLDVVLGGLLGPRYLGGLKEDMAAVVRQRMEEVSQRFVLALFRDNQMLAEKCLDNKKVCRDILRILVENMDVVDSSQHKKLLETYARSIDMDPLEVLSGAVIETKNRSEYDRSVLAVAVGATKMTTIKLFHEWCQTTIQMILEGSTGRLSTRVLVDAWGLLARHQLSQHLLVSYSVMLLERANEGRIYDLLMQLVGACNKDGQERIVMQLEKYDKVEMAGKVPWSCLKAKTAAWDRFVKQMLAKAESQLDASLVGGLERLAGVDDRLYPMVSQLYQAVPRLLEKALKMREPVVVEGLLATINQATIYQDYLVETLDVCASQLDNSVFRSPACGYQLAILAGNVASRATNPGHLKPVFEMLLGTVNVSGWWIASNEAHRQLVKLGMDATKSEIVETLVSEQNHAGLLKFIERQPAGRDTEDRWEAYGRMLKEDEEGIVKWSEELRRKLDKVQMDGWTEEEKERLKRELVQLNRILRRFV